MRTVHIICHAYISSVFEAVLVLIMASLLKSKIKERRRGGCGCGCPGCSGSCTYRSENRREEKANEA